MNLDLINNFLDGLSSNKFVQNFMDELSKYLESNIGKEGSKVSIIEDILSENKLTTGNRNAITSKYNDIILDYAKNNFYGEQMYFVKDSKKTYWLNNEKHYNDNAYAVLKVENNKIEEIEIDKNDISKDINVNDVFTIKDGKYVIDDLATKEIKEEITNISNDIIDKQNEKLSNYRKEGHLYMVSEEIGDNRFLWDLTDAPEFEFEEIDIPKDVLNKASQGAVLKYTNGTYEYYSDDGFERAEKIHKNK